MSIKVLTFFSSSYNFLGCFIVRLKNRVSQADNVYFIIKSELDNRSARALKLSSDLKISQSVWDSLKELHKCQHQN